MRPGAVTGVAEVTGVDLMLHRNKSADPALLFPVTALEIDGHSKGQPD